MRKTLIFSIIFVLTACILSAGCIGEEPYEDWIIKPTLDQSDMTAIMNVNNVGFLIYNNDKITKWSATTTRGKTTFTVYGKDYETDFTIYGEDYKTTFTVFGERSKTLKNGEIETKYLIEVDYSDPSYGHLVIYTEIDRTLITKLIQSDPTCKRYAEFTGKPRYYSQMTEEEQWDAAVDEWNEMTKEEQDIRIREIMAEYST